MEGQSSIEFLVDGQDIYRGPIRWQLALIRTLLVSKIFIEVFLMVRNFIEVLAGDPETFRYPSLRLGFLSR